MKEFHVITGMLRSGSTLLCNLLNQNERNFASSTSGLCNVLAAATSALSISDEVRSELIVSKEGALEKVRRVQRGIIESWYEDLPEGTIIFDKSRGWSAHALLLNRILPEAKLIVMVRDIKGVVASIEKQHRKTAELEPNMAEAHTFTQRMGLQLAEGGIIGSAINAIMDLAFRNPDNVIFVKYELLVRDPKATMQWLYKEMGKSQFIHDFENVQNTAKDVDGLYWHKFPHEGMGKVIPLNDVDRYIPDFIQDEIDTKFPSYNSKFSYKVKEAGGRRG